MVRGSEETCNRKARDSDELLLTEKESSADDVQSDQNIENNKSLNDQEAIRNSEDERTESTQKKNNVNKTNKSILLAAKIKKVATSTSSSESESSRSPQKKTKAKNNEKGTKIQSTQRRISRHSLTTSSSMTFTTNQVFTDCLSSNARPTCCCCIKLMT